MAKDKIVPIAIQIEGKNSGVTKSLQEINKDLSKTQSALKDVQKALELDPGNVELLAQQEELLNKQVDQTNEKLRVLKTVAEDAAKGLEEGTVTKEQYASLTAEIVKTEAGLRDLETAADGTGEAMENVIPEDAGAQLGDMSQQSENAGLSLDDLKTAALAAGPAIGAALAIVGTGLSVLSDFAAAAIEAGQAVGEFLADRAEDAAKALGDTLSELKDFTIAASSYADEILTMTKTTGISTESLQELAYMAELVDVDLGTITGSITKLEKSMSKYADGNKDTIAAFDNLGVAVFDANGHLRDAEDVFWDLITALGNMDNESARDIASMDLLGKSAKSLNPIILAGVDAIDAYREEAYKMGYVLEDDTLEALGDFDDSLQRLDKGVQAAQNALGLVLLPLLSDLATDGVDLLGEFNRGLIEADGDLTKIGNVVSTTVPKLLDVALKNLPQAVNLVSELLTAVISVVRENSGEVLDAVFQVVETVADELLSPDNIEDVFAAIQTIISNISTFFQEHGEELISIGVTIITSLVNGLSETLPVLIPAATSAITTIVNALTSPENLNAILGSATMMILAFANSMADAIPDLEAAVPPLVDAIAAAITVLEPTIMDAGIMLLEALLQSEGENENISKIIDILAPAILDLVIKFGEKIVENSPEISAAFADIFLDLCDDMTTYGEDLVSNLISGINNKLGELSSAAGALAAEIAKYIHFSVPDVGPLADADQYGGDLVDLYAESIEKELPVLQQSVEQMAGTIAGTAAPDYSGQLDGINGNLAAIAGAENQIVIPVYIGGERIETIVARANVSNNFLSGGR